MVFYYTSWNTLETQEVSSWFQRALKETSAMKWVNSHLTFIYLFCLLLFLLFLLFFIIFNTFIGFSVQFEACMFIVFGFVFGSLIVGLCIQSLLEWGYSQRLLVFLREPMTIL